MKNLTVQIDESGAMNVTAARRPPPPVYPNSVYLQCSADDAAIVALSLTIPSLSSRSAATLADALRKAADELVSPATVRRAGSPKDRGVVIDLMSIMSE